MMEKWKVLIRADGDSEIGLGHLVRCTALAQMIQAEFEVTFICKEIPDSYLLELKKLGIDVLSILTEDDFITKVDFSSIVVLDHYLLNSEVQLKIKERKGILVCIDDLHEVRFYADLIINPAPGIAPSNYIARDDTQFALGLDYALLRREFMALAQRGIKPRRSEVGFICFGGSDPKNLTRNVLEVLIKDVRFRKIIVVVGSSYRYLSDLQQAVAGDLHVEVHHSVDSAIMVNLMVESDVAVVPASGILQEVLAAGCRVISGMYVENQKYVYHNYNDLGVFESAGNFTKPEIARAVDKLFDKVEKPKVKLIDGFSARRILFLFRQMVIESTVRLRSVEENDMMLTYTWADNSELRRYSFNKSVSLGDHIKWFTDKLADQQCVYLIGEINGKAFGSLRYDIIAGQAKISYLVDPDFQQMGLGTILVKHGLRYLLKYYAGSISAIWGEVFIENKASEGIFIKLGYTLESKDNGILKFKKKLSRSV